MEGDFRFESIITIAISSERMKIKEKENASHSCPNSKTTWKKISTICYNWQFCFHVNPNKLEILC